MDTTGLSDQDRRALEAADAALDGLRMAWAARSRSDVDDANDGCELTGDELGLNRFVRDF